MLKEKGTRSTRNVSNKNDGICAPTLASASKTTLTNNASNSFLSTAAAVAALHAHPMSLTSVADLQTKRMLRKINSRSSEGSVKLRSSGSRIHRRKSSGSMSERSSREFSPIRPRVGISSNHISGFPSISKRNRSASVSVATLPGLLPLCKNAEPRTDPPIPSPGTKRISSIQKASCLDRQLSRESINFSLPTGSRPISPVTKSLLSSSSIGHLNKSSLVHDIKSTNLNLGANKSTSQIKREHAGNKIIDNKAAQNHALEIRKGRTVIEKEPTLKVIDRIEVSEQQSPQAIRIAGVSEQRDTEAPSVFELAAISTSEAKMNEKSSYKVGSNAPSSQRSKIADVGAKIMYQNTKVNKKPDTSTSKKKAYPKQEDVHNLSSGLVETQNLSLPFLLSDQGRTETLPHSSILNTKTIPNNSSDHQSHNQPSQTWSQPDSVFVHAGKINTPNKVPSSSIEVVSGVDENDNSSTQSTYYTNHSKKIVTKHTLSPLDLSPRKSTTKFTESSIVNFASPISSVLDSTETPTSKALLSNKKPNRVSFDAREAVSEEMTPDSDSPDVKVSLIIQPRFCKEKSEVELSKINDTKVLTSLISLESLKKVRSQNCDADSFYSAKKNETSSGCSSPTLVLSDSPVKKFEDPTKIVSSIILGSTYERNTTDKQMDRDVTNGTTSDTCGNYQDTIITQGFGKTKHANNLDSELRCESESKNVKAQVKLGDASVNFSENLQLPVKVSANGDLEDSSKFETSSKRIWLRIPGAWESLTEISHEASSFADLGTSEAGANKVQNMRQINTELSLNPPHFTIEESEITEGSETESIYSNAVERISDLEDNRFTSINAVVDSSISNSSPSGLNQTLKTSPPLLKSNIQPIESNDVNSLRESKTRRQNSRRILEDQNESNKDTKENLSFRQEDILEKSALAQNSGETNYPEDKTQKLPNTLRSNYNSHHQAKSTASYKPSGLSTETLGTKGLSSLRPARKLPGADKTRSLTQKQDTGPFSPKSQTKVTVMSQYHDKLSKLDRKLIQSAAKSDQDRPIPLRRKTSRGSISSFERVQPTIEPLKFRRSMRGPGELRTSKVKPPSAIPAQSSLPQPPSKFISNQPQTSNINSLISSSSKKDMHKFMRNSSLSTTSSRFRSSRFGRLSLEGNNNTLNQISHLTSASDDEIITSPASRSHSNNNRAIKSYLRHSKTCFKRDFNQLFGQSKFKDECSRDFSNTNDTLLSLDVTCNRNDIIGNQSTDASYDLESKGIIRKTSLNQSKISSQHDDKSSTLPASQKERINVDKVKKKSGFTRLFSINRGLGFNQPQEEVDVFLDSEEPRTDDTLWPLPAGAPPMPQNLDRTSKASEMAVFSLTDQHSSKELFHHIKKPDEDLARLNAGSCSHVTFTSKSRNKEKKFSKFRRIFNMND